MAEICNMWLIDTEANYMYQLRHCQGNNHVII